MRKFVVTVSRTSEIQSIQTVLWGGFLFIVYKCIQTSGSESHKVKFQATH